MAGDLPDYYFRVRENGALVFRVDTENRQRRIEMDQLAARDVDDILRAVDHLNLTTQWVQTRATDEQLDAVTDTLLLAMHDLRTVLVRKKADRLMKGE